MAFAKFMASPTGRIARIIAGLALIGVGLLAIQGVTGYILAAIGLVPLGAGLLDVCLIAPLIGKPFTGRDIRALA